MRWISYLIFLLVVLLGISFAVLNAKPVVINYYIATREMPLSLLLVIALGAGLLLGWITNVLFWIRMKAENHRLKRQLVTLEKEVSNLRTSPLKDSA